MHKDLLLVLSNTCYLVPALVAFNKTRRGELDSREASELIAVFLFLAFFASWSYHDCRNKKEKGTCTNNTLSWVTCLPGSDDAVHFNVLRFVDHFTAIFTMILAVTHAVPLKPRFRKTFMVLSTIWMLTMLSAGNHWFAVLPVVVAFTVLGLFWWYVRQKGRRNALWALATISFLVGSVLFVIPEPYWLNHSMWHILSALAAALLLEETANCFQNTGDDRDIPDHIKYLFRSRQTCKHRKYEQS
jgi:hypothetical protein